MNSVSGLVQAEGIEPGGRRLSRPGRAELSAGLTASALGKVTRRVSELPKLALTTSVVGDMVSSHPSSRVSCCWAEAETRTGGRAAGRRRVGAKSRRGGAGAMGLERAAGEWVSSESVLRYALDATVSELVVARPWLAGLRTAGACRAEPKSSARAPQASSTSPRSISQTPSHHVVSSELHLDRYFTPAHIRLAWPAVFPLQPTLRSLNLSS